VKLSKKETRLAVTITGAAAFAFFVRTFPLGDSIVGGLIGSSMGLPWLGLAVGALTPSRRSADEIVARSNRTPMVIPPKGRIGITVGDYTAIARYYREEAEKAAGAGRTEAARQAMAKAVQAEAAA